MIQKNNHLVEHYYDNIFAGYIKRLEINNYDLYNSLNEIGDVYDKWVDEYNSRTPIIQWHKYRLLEFIQTINPELLHNRLCDLPNYIEMFYQQPLWYIAFKLNDTFNKNNKKFDDNFEIILSQIIEACGYTESYRDISLSNSKIIEIALMPNYTIDLTDYVYNVNSTHKAPGILYHICPKYIWKNKIKHNGLIPKCGNKHKRYYLPKAYFYTQIIDFEKYAYNLSKGITNTRYKEYVNANEYVVLKIDLNKAIAKENYKFYNDDEYPIMNLACYTYDTIHPKCIELYQEISLK